MNHATVQPDCRHRWIRSAALLALLAMTGSSLGQDAPAASEPVETIEVDVEVVEGPLSRPPLLREGSVLASVKGRLIRDDLTGWWQFIVQSENERTDVAPHELIMLPNTRLEEMQQIVQSAGDQEALFDLTGEVFVYGNRNFLLATMAPQIVEYREPEPAPVVTTPPADVDPETPEGDSVEDIMRQLAEAVGPLQRSTRPVVEEEDGLALADSALPIREEAFMLSRRGRLRRTNAGAWIFVFDADSAGLADPPLVVLPCLLLQRMQRLAGLSTSNASIIISGRIFRYGDQRYLLPTVYRNARERTQLTR